MTRLIAMRVTDTHYRQLVEIAEANHMPVTAFIRQAIDEAVSDCREVGVFGGQHAVTVFRITNQD